MGRKKGRRRSAFKLKLKKEILFSIASVGLMVTGLLVIVSFAGQGEWLQSIQSTLREKFGVATLLIPYLFISAGLMLTQLKWRITKPNVFLGAMLLFASLLGLFQSGTVGEQAYLNLSQLVMPIGSSVILLAIGLIGIMIMTEVSIDEILIALHKIISGLGGLGKIFPKVNSAPKYTLSRPGIKIQGGQRHDEPPEKDKNEDKPTPKKEPATILPQELGKEVIANTPALAQQVYQKPPLSLLENKIGGEADRGDINQNASIIEQTLESFGIKTQVKEVNLGPAVTQYALEIARGTKLSKITTLQNDLALSLAAPTGQIRIEAPIPGRSMVGIEIPNRKPEFVSLKSMLNAKDLQKNKSKLAVGLGLNVSGQVVVADIAKMPHVLIAGATGSGKSVSVNAIIAQILFRASPEEVKFIMVDPKRVELTQYNGVPHLLTPVIVDPEKVVAALGWAVHEMETRYKLFAEVGVRNIESYNNMSGFQALPYIIIIIDELADIMLFNPAKVEDVVTRLAQMARATGIHLLLATQRPSVDVLTGLIKANIPCRIAFNVTSMIDSRVILDGPGAEKLLGRGDMLYIPPEQAKPTRIQGAFVSDGEMRKVLDFIKQTTTTVQYTEEVTTKFADKKMVGADGVSEDQDPMFEQAVRIIVNYDRASASLLQRRLSIGYARAARILDQLQSAGIVGASSGSKPREVLIKSPDDYFAKQAT